MDYKKQLAEQLIKITGNTFIKYKTYVVESSTDPYDWDIGNYVTYHRYEWCISKNKRLVLVTVEKDDGLPVEDHQIKSLKVIYHICGVPIFILV